jgi:hypothetical protein
MPRIVIADVNGDRRDDIGTVLQGGELRFWLSTGDLSGDFRLIPRSVGAGFGWTLANRPRILVADINGDGKDDLGRNESNGDVTMCASVGDGQTFDPCVLVQTGWTVANMPRILVADINGDGKDDLAGVQGSGPIQVYLATGDLTGDEGPYTPAGRGDTGPINGTAARIIVADVNGDGRDDIGAVNADGDINVALATGESQPWGPGTTWVKTRWTANNVLTGI